MACHSVCCAILAFLVLYAGESQAQIVEKEITLPEAFELFEQNNLALQLARSTAREWKAKAQQASSYPNPTLQVLHEPLFDGGETISESYFNISQRIEWPGLRNARIDASRQLAVSAEARLKTDSLNLLFELTRTFIEAASLRQQLDHLEAVTDVFRDADQAAEAQFQSGELSAYSRQRLRIERARYENRLAVAQLAIQQKERNLSTLIIPEFSLTRYIPVYALAVLPTPPSLSTLLTSAQANRSEYVEARSALEAARYSLTEAEKSLVSSPLITTGYKRQSNGFNGIFLGAQVDVPVFDQKKGLIRTNTERLHQAETHLMIVEQYVELDVVQSLDSFNSLFDRVTLISEDLLSESDLLIASARISYAEGEMSLIELLDAAEAFYDAKVTSTQLLSEALIAYYNLMRSAGTIPLN